MATQVAAERLLQQHSRSIDLSVCGLSRKLCLLMSRLETSWSPLTVNSKEQEGLAVASIARDDPSTLRGDDPFPRARMHRDRNARKIGIGI